MKFLWTAVLVACASTLARADDTIVLLPKGWNGTGPLPAAIWLHGYLANPSRLTEDKHYQDSADKLGIAIIGVPATRKVDEHSFIWADEPTLDHEHVTQVVAEVEKSHHLTFSRKALFGFSQGAVVAAEIAARYPSEFMGAIILSPGADSIPAFISGGAQNKAQHYFISVGAAEHPGNLAFARNYHKILAATGAIVSFREFPGMKDHNRPPDWPERFPEWLKVILAL